MRITVPRRTAVSIIAAGLVAIAFAFAPTAPATAPVNGKYRTYAYIVASRTSSTVQINGLVKQDYSTGLIRSHGRTIYLQRRLNGTWQTMLSRVTDWYGRFAVVYVSVATYSYRYVVTASGSAWGTTSGVATPPAQTVNQQIGAYAKTFVGRYPYVSGGSSPATGFDCSGLTSYIYRHFGRTIASTAQGQYNQFRRLTRSSAWPGDLVFFHDGSGYVFHVGVYEGANMMVAAATPQDGIRYQSIWSSNVTFGTITH